MDPNLTREIAAAAHRYNLPVALLTAIVEHESSGDIYAYKVEPPYRYLVDCKTGKPFRALTAVEIASEAAPRDFPTFAHSSRDTEWWGQQASWGPMQVMGAVAREYGFTGRFPALCSPSLGIQYGAQHLHNLRNRFLKKYGWMGVAAAFNAGTPRANDKGIFDNQVYVDRIAINGGFEFDEQHYA